VQGDTGDARRIGHLLGGEAPTQTRQTQALTELSKLLALIFGKLGAGRHESYFIKNLFFGIQVLTMSTF
jgi:hypothetical protein